MVLVLVSEDVEVVPSPGAGARPRVGAATDLRANGVEREGVADSPRWSE